MLLLQMLWLTLMIVGMATMTARSVNFMVIVFLHFGDWWPVYFGVANIHRQKEQIKRILSGKPVPASPLTK